MFHAALIWWQTLDPVLWAPWCCSALPITHRPLSCQSLSIWGHLGSGTMWRLPLPTVSYSSQISHPLLEDTTRSFAPTIYRFMSLLPSPGYHPTPNSFSLSPPSQPPPSQACQEWGWPQGSTLHRPSLREASFWSVLVSWGGGQGAVWKEGYKPFRTVAHNLVSPSSHLGGSINEIFKHCHLVINLWCSEIWETQQFRASNTPSLRKEKRPMIKLQIDCWLVSANISLTSHLPHGQLVKL